MFSRKKSPVKKKFAKAGYPKKYRRQMDPRTVILLRQLFLGCVTIFVFILIGVLIWYVSRLSLFNIDTVSANGGETIDASEVETMVRSLLVGDYIGLVPRTFIWTYPEEEILQAVSSVSRVKQPVVVRKGRELTIKYDEYFPYALWCPSQSDENCVFIDETGFAFASAPKLEGGALMRYSKIGVEPILQQTLLDASSLESIQNLEQEISRKLNLPISFIESDITGDVFMSVSGGGEIKISLKMTPQETFDNLQSILAAPEFADIKPGSFQYIDLRFGNKVFVNEEIVTASSTSATTTIENIIPATIEGITASTT